MRRVARARARGTHREHEDGGRRRGCHRGPEMAAHGRRRRRITRRRRRREGQHATHVPHGRRRRLVDLAPRRSAASMESVREERQPFTFAQRGAPSSPNSHRRIERNIHRGERCGRHGGATGFTAVPRAVRDSNPRLDDGRRRYYRPGRLARFAPRRSARARRGVQAEPTVSRGPDARVRGETAVAETGPTRPRGSVDRDVRKDGVDRSPGRRRRRRSTNFIIGSKNFNGSKRVPRRRAAARARVPRECVRIRRSIRESNPGRRVRAGGAHRRRATRRRQRGGSQAFGITRHRGARGRFGFVRQ